MLLSDAACVPVPRDGDALPPAARALLAATPPAAVVGCGPLDLLRLPLLAVFSSAATPPALVLPAHDLARDLRDRGLPTVGGFHAPVERDVLAFLLSGTQPVVACPARRLSGMRPPPPWSRALAEGRLLLLSLATPGRRRPTARMAEARNRLAAALAERVFVVHASPGGAVYRLAREALERRQTVLCFDHRSNRDLVLLGATPVERVP